MAIRGGWKARHTEEEDVWARQVIEEHFKDKLIKGKEIKKLGLIGIFEEKFNKKSTSGAMYRWLRKTQNPDLGKGGSVKSKEKEYINVLENAKYILYVFNEGVTGYDTKEQVKEDLAKRAPKAPIRLFENIPAEVKLLVEVVL